MADVPCLGMKPILTLDGAYTTKITQTSDGNDLDEYIGIAKPGTATSAASWQIKKIVYTGTLKVSGIVWASGNDLFDKVFDNRAGYSYS